MAFPTHGMTGSKTFQAWQSMMNRCTNQYAEKYPDYGGRGIRVCERWNLFENFLQDMGVAPEGLSLERKDNSKGYGPDNCKWATCSEQSRNRRSNHLITYKGQTLTLMGWSEKLGMKFNTLSSRLNQQGWSVEKAFTKPLR